MTKKHFLALARAIKNARGAMSASAYEHLVEDVAEVCDGANSAFDRARFVAYCHE